jgi:hypothetical protein
MPNRVNSDLLKEFYLHMEDNGISKLQERKNAFIHFAEHIGTSTSVFDLDHKQVLRFLDT